MGNKVITSISVDAELRRLAKRRGINISEEVEKSIKRKLYTGDTKEELETALEEVNERIESLGKEQEELEEKKKELADKITKTPSVQNDTTDNEWIMKQLYGKFESNEEIPRMQFVKVISDIMQKQGLQVVYADVQERMNQLSRKKLIEDNDECVVLMEREEQQQEEEEEDGQEE